MAFIAARRQSTTLVINKNFIAKNYRFENFLQNIYDVP